MALTRELKYEDVRWDFRGEPQFKLASEEGGYGANTSVDPTPCYPHNIDLVAKLLEELQSIFPIPNVKCYVSHFEGTERTNGWAQRCEQYYGDVPDEQKVQYLIFLSGKRTPIHPAMTRYLVAHEYGHLVEYWLKDSWKEKRHEIRDVYKTVRGLPDTTYYGPGSWHLIPGEVFANDFRVVVAKHETEYWPHPGVERPSAQVEAWWRTVHEDPTNKERWGELLELSGRTDDV